MMYSSATFLASLLASAHGFAAIPAEVECSANEQKFFVYSIDLSMIYPFTALFPGGPDFTDNETVTRGLVGNTWQGVQLSITQGDTTITQAGGKPLTVTSPNTLESGGFNVVSEDFCLGYGTWTVKATAPTHPEMASYNRTNNPGYNGNYNLAQRLAPGAPVYAVTVQPQELVDWIKGPPFNRDVNNYNNNTACNNDPTESLDCAFYEPFFFGWGIFPAEMRAAAEAAASTGPLGTSFIADNSGKDLDPRQVVPSSGRGTAYNSGKNVVVPIREDSDLRRRLSVGGSSSTRG